jgi:hypothetical protein
MALLIKAGQMTASDYVPTYPHLLLASEGASTEAIRRVIRKRQECPTIRIRFRPKSTNIRRSDAALGMSVHAYTCPCQHFLFKGIIGVAKGLPEAV